MTSHVDASTNTDRIAAQGGTDLVSLPGIDRTCSLPDTDGSCIAHFPPQQTDEADDVVSDCNYPVEESQTPTS